MMLDTSTILNMRH